MIVVKLVISICIVCATTIIGSLKAKKLKDREYILREMVTFLKLVQNEIQYMMSILPNAYEISRQKLVTELKISIGQIVIDMLNSNGDFLIDQSIVTNISKIEGLTDYDKSVFTSTLKNLGRSDLEGQINIIQNGITIIENQIKEASQIKISNSKLYKTMGIISGLMIVIIFI